VHNVTPAFREAGVFPRDFSFADFFVVSARAFNWYGDGWAGPHNVPGSQPLIFALSASTAVGAKRPFDVSQVPIVEKYRLVALSLLFVGSTPAQSRVFAG
jgi:hypothetical protein